MILDAAGRMVTTLYEGPLGRGLNELDWNGAYSNGSKVPAGVYFYVIEAAGLGRSGGKIVVVR